MFAKIWFWQSCAMFSAFPSIPVFVRSPVPVIHCILDNFPAIPRSFHISHRYWLSTFKICSDFWSCCVRVLAKSIPWALPSYCVMSTADFDLCLSVSCTKCILCNETWQGLSANLCSPPSPSGPLLLMSFL